jgi:hypothetical protein
MKRTVVVFAALTILALGGCASPVSDTGTGENPARVSETGQGRAPLTAPVSFAQTGDNSAGLYFDVDAWTVEEGAEQWRLAVVEQGSVSFGVRKAPGQSISVGGSAAEWVSRAAAADGSVAGEDFALFTVETAQILDGGERVFTLTVSEPDREQRTVGIRLEVEADLSRGVGVFFVQKDDGLVRITPENAEVYANEFYVRDREANFEKERSNGLSKWKINFADVDTLFEALTWVDQYAQSGAAERYQEYRIRVEKDEAVIPTLLSCGRDVGIDRNRADYVCFSLRGHGQERTITKVPDIHPTEYKIVANGSVSALIQVGYDDFASGSKHIALRLGENIRIDAQRDLYPGEPGSWYSGGWQFWIIEIEPNGILTMEKGSTLANHSGVAVWASNTGNGTKPGLFELKGGTIMNCGGYLGAYFEAITLAGEYTDALGYTTKSFRFYSGFIFNNYNDNLIRLPRNGEWGYLPYTYFAVDG